MNSLLNKYYQQILKDYKFVTELYEIKVSKPMQLGLRQHIKIHGFFTLMFKLVWIVLVKIPITWPFWVTTYLWGVCLTYFFLPVVWWLEQQIDKNDKSILVYFVGVDPHKVLFWVLEIQWWLKTWLGLIHVFDLIVKWWHSLPGVIVFVLTYLDSHWQTFKRNATTRDGAIDIWLRYLVNNRIKIVNNLHKYLWIKPKIFVTTWLNPHKYKLFRLIFYKVNRRRIYTWLYCRWLIRYKIFKGLVKYWIISAWRIGWRRLLLRIKYIYKMMRVRWHIRHLYNRIVLKIYKIVYYICRELIYIWTAITLLLEIGLILFCKLLPLFSLLWWLITRLFYILWALINLWFYHIFYSYQWYQVWFVKGCSSSFRALTIQNKMGMTTQKVLGLLKLDVNNNASPAPISKPSPVHITRRVKLKNCFIKFSTRVWKIWFGNEAILFKDIKPSNKTEKEEMSLSESKNKTRQVGEDIWTRTWKWFCPPLWLESCYPKTKRGRDSKFDKGSKSNSKAQSHVGRKSSSNKSAKG